MTMTSGVGRVETRFTTVAECGLTLDCGRVLGPITVAWEQYGAVNRDRTNVVLVCHALSGGAHAAGWHEPGGKAGWWDAMVGPGRAFDTTRYCVVSTNVLGGCYGTTGPASVDPATGNAFGPDFPPVDGLGHGPSAARAARPPRRPLARRGRRRIDGRDAGARLGCALPGLGEVGRRDRGNRPPLAAADRAQRGGATRHHRRPRVARRPVRGRGRAGCGPRCRPDARPHHVPVRRRDGTEVRAEARAGTGRPDRGTRNSRSNGISITRGRASSAASTPTRCST